MSHRDTVSYSSIANFPKEGLLAEIPDDILQLIGSDLDPSTLFALAHVNHSLHGIFRHSLKKEFTGESAMLCAAMLGYTSLVQWFLTFPLYYEGKVLRVAAEGGHLDILSLFSLDFLIENQYFLTKGAIAGGQVHIVAWASENNLLDDTCPGIDRALECGNLDMLKWLHRHLPSTFREELYGTSKIGQAARGGQLEVVDWLWTIGYNWNECTIEQAAMSGHLHLVKHMHEARCPWDCRTCTGAASENHLEVLKWIRARGCPWNSSVCSLAAYKGHFELLKWARENGAPWDEETCSAAAQGNSLEILQWLRANGCPWDSGVCTEASENDNMEILKWAVENGCPVEENTFYIIATEGKLEMIKYLYEMGCPWDSTTTMGTAIGGHLDSLIWLREQGCPWDERTTYFAAKFEHFTLLRWAVENGCPRY